MLSINIARYGSLESRVKLHLKEMYSCFTALASYLSSLCDNVISLAQGKLSPLHALTGHCRVKSKVSCSTVTVSFVCIPSLSDETGNHNQVI